MSEPSQIESSEGGEEWADVGTYRSLDEAYDHGLVVLAMGESVRVAEGNAAGEFELQTEAEAVPKVLEELEEYSVESQQKQLAPMIPSNWARHPAGWLYVLVWATALLVVFYLQQKDPSIANRGASSSIGLIDRGEWWRPFTALFMHGDGPHIVGNLATGTVFGILVSKSLGPIKGWGMILLAGATGNAMTSWITHPEPFSSLGASTAVFGALGILSGVGVVENFREEVRMPWLRVMAPLIAGFILLGWLGGATPGSNTDVFGHVFGFCAGMVAGIICRALEATSETLHGGENQAD